MLSICLIFHQKQARYAYKRTMLIKRKHVVSFAMEAHAGMINLIYESKFNPLLFKTSA